MFQQVFARLGHCTFLRDLSGAHAVRALSALRQPLFTSPYLTDEARVESSAGSLVAAHASVPSLGFCWPRQEWRWVVWYRSPLRATWSI
jgi:hypothetical protein